MRENARNGDCLKLTGFAQLGATPSFRPLCWIKFSGLRRTISVAKKLSGKEFAELPTSFGRDMGRT